MPVSLSGMASGLDTDSVIQQLMAIEQNKVTAVQKRQVSVTQHKTDLGTIKTKLDAVKSVAADLSSATLWKPVQTTTSSDPTKVDVSVLAGAGIGGHSIQVNRLASSAQHGFSYDNTGVTTDGKLKLFYNSDPTAVTEITVKANATATDIATAINANDKAPVYAAVVKDAGGERLVFSSRKTGQSSDFTVDTSALADPSKMTELAAYSRTGTTLNADILVDGVAPTDPVESNVIENAIPGVRLTLKGVSASPVTVTTTQPAVDMDAITKKIQALVDAYNAFVTSARSELSEKRVPNANTSSDLQKGQLFGDTGLVSILGQLKSTMTKTLTGLGLKNLADIGVTVPKAGASPEDAKDGKLTVDSEKLKTVLNADYTKVKELFAGNGTTKGLGSAISDYVSAQTGAKGTLTTRVNSDEATLKGFTAQIDKLTERMDTEQKRLKAQFAAMETALHNSQTQQAWLTSQIATLPSYSA
jgi:flagellar hook-associated protein 2